MYIPDIETHHATSLDEASSLATRYAPNARFMAGGTDLLVDLKAKRVTTDHVIALDRIAELRGVTAEKDGIRIGALTTPNQLAASEIVRERFPVLVEATRDMAAPQIRNMATVGGNIASAIPSADLPPSLIVSNASVTLWSPRGERTLPLESFFVGPRQSVREPDEVLTSIFVPYPQVYFGAAYARFALRAANACAVAAVAGSLQLDERMKVQEARVVLCAVAPTPKLVTAVNEVLAGRVIDDSALAGAAEAAMKAADPISDIRGSDEFRRNLVGVLTRRALAGAAQRAKEVTA